MHKNSRCLLFCLSLLLSFLPSVSFAVATDASARESLVAAAAAKPELGAVAGVAAAAVSASAAASLVKCVPKAIDIFCFVNPCALLLCPSGTQCVRDICFPCKAHCEPLHPPTCLVDSNCGRNQWCRLGKCVDFVDDGESCGGFVPAEFQRKCKPTSQCVQSTPNIPDLPGICRPKCKKNSDCSSALVVRHWSDFWIQKSNYCSYDGVCLKRGQCRKAKDCYKPGNLFLSPYCVGFFRCKNGKCVKVCLSEVVLAQIPKLPIPGPDPAVIIKPKLVELKHDQDESPREDGNQDANGNDDQATSDTSTGELVEEEIAIDTEASDSSTGGVGDEKKGDADVDTTPTPEEPDQLVDEAEKEEEEEQDNEGK